MTDDPRTAEGLRRIKLSIDRQLSGDIEDAFGCPCGVHMEHAVINVDGEDVWVPLAITPNGRFAITADGEPHRIEAPLQ